jgi:hypothetical protein
MSEPDEIGWSEYMEQTLTQYLAAHPHAARFDLASIDCRTSFCEIQVLGYDESANASRQAPVASR